MRWRKRNRHPERVAVLTNPPKMAALPGPLRNLLARLLSGSDHTPWPLTDAPLACLCPFSSAVGRLLLESDDWSPL